MKAVIDELTDLLDVERTLLLSGRIEDILRLQDLKAALAKRLDGDVPGNVSGMSDLRKAASRNMKLLEAARRGLAEARDLLGGKCAPQTSTYTAAGQTHMIGSAATRLARNF